MKAIRFFSQFAIICNLCFVLFALFNYFESGNTNANAAGTVDRIPFVKEVIIILGFPAIIINLLMCLVYLILIAMGKAGIIPRWLAIINTAFLLIQFAYFFLT